MGVESSNKSTQQRGLELPPAREPESKQTGEWRATENTQKRSGFLSQSAFFRIFQSIEVAPLKLEDYVIWGPKLISKFGSSI